MIIHKCKQDAFELLARQSPRATARLIEGVARRVAAATAARTRPLAYDPSGRAAMASAVPWRTGGAEASGESNRDSRRGEIVTIALVPAGMSICRTCNWPVPKCTS